MRPLLQTVAFIASALLVYLAIFLSEDEEWIIAGIRDVVELVK